jgi:hypothetical protein
MHMKNIWKLAFAGFVLVALAVAAAGFVSAQTEENPEATPESSPRMKPGVFEDFKARLAENLGITEEELEATVDETALDLIDEALAEGTIDEELAERLRQRVEEGEGFPGPGFGKHPHPGMCRGGHLVGDLAEFLGIEEQAIAEALEGGQTLAEVIEANGGDADAFVDEQIAQIAERLAQAVDGGKLSQERADEMLANAEEMITNALDNNEVGPCIGLAPRGRFDGGVAPPDAAPSDLPEPEGAAIQF